MGRNGAGKSTLLRHAAGLRRPTRGRVEHTGRVALLLQNPGDYLVHETVSQEASPGALAGVGLTALGERNPRDLSGGERQRLALAVVLDAPQDPAADPGPWRTSQGFPAWIWACAVTGRERPRPTPTSRKMACRIDA